MALREEGQVITIPPVLPPGTGDVINLEVPFFDQKKTNWCWAACVQMVIPTHPEQRDVAKKAFPRRRCQAQPSPCNVPLDDGRITDLWHAHCLMAAHLVITGINCGMLQTELNARRPIEVGVKKTRRKGHVIILYGWGTEISLGIYFHVNDPAVKQGIKYCPKIMKIASKAWFGLGG